MLGNVAIQIPLHGYPRANLLSLTTSPGETGLRDAIILTRKSYLPLRLYTTTLGSPSRLATPKRSLLSVLLLWQRLPLLALFIHSSPFLGMNSLVNLQTIPIRTLPRRLGDTRNPPLPTTRGTPLTLSLPVHPVTNVLTPPPNLRNSDLYLLALNASTILRVLG